MCKRWHKDNADVEQAPDPGGVADKMKRVDDQRIRQFIGGNSGGMSQSAKAMIRANASTTSARPSGVRARRPAISRRATVVSHAALRATHVPSQRSTPHCLALSQPSSVGVCRRVTEDFDASSSRVKQAPPVLQSAHPPERPKATAEEHRAQQWRREHASKTSGQFSGLRQNHPTSAASTTISATGPAEESLLRRSSRGA